MDVENGIREFFDERRTDEPHESGKADEADVWRAQLTHERVIVVVAGRPGAMGEADGLDSGRPRSIQPRSTFSVGNDDRDRSVEAALRDRVDECLKIASASRDEDAEAAVHRRLAYVTPGGSPGMISPIARASRPERAASSPRSASAWSRPVTMIRPIPMLNVRIMSSIGMSPFFWSHLKIGGTSHVDPSTTAAVPCGSTRGRLSVIPPPVMCAIAFMRPASSKGLMNGKYDRCGSSSGSPTVRDSSGT